MVRHRRVVMAVKACFTGALALVLSAMLLAGCVHYVPREERQTDTTAEETAELPTDTEATGETTAAPTDTSFPNEPEDGHTKRY